MVRFERNIGDKVCGSELVVQYKDGDAPEHSGRVIGVLSWKPNQEPKLSFGHTAWALSLSEMENITSRMKEVIK